MKQSILSVDSGSPAEKAGIRPGDLLLSINGHEILDVLDYRYHSENRLLTLQCTRNGEEHYYMLKKPDSEPLGLNFETYLMDRPRSCVNHCLFCFIDQLPPGMRESLYFKDDDSRLSFLQGNYITLTNLSEREIQRIMALRISPVNVSVHTTNPALRCRLLNNPRAGACYKIMQRFAAAGISMLCQIVLCPGYNDGAELRRSMEDLAALHPAVQSVSIVPVGLTRFRDGLPALTAVDAELAGEVIRQVTAFGDGCKRRLGTRLFYCGDEFYVRAGLPVPAWEDYEGFPQFENGVGMLRSLEDEFTDALRNRGTISVPPTRFSVATGKAAAGLLQKLLQMSEELCYNIHGQVYAIENRFFGSSVNVAGLLTGQDLIAQLRGKALGSRLLITANMLRHGGDMFLDNLTPEEVSRELGVPVIPVPNDGEALLGAFLDERNPYV